MPALADFPELVGFFSYSREDDEGSRGALSALRDAIQRELSAQLGRSKSNAQHNRADERGRVGPAARFDSTRFRVAAAQLNLACGRNCGAAAVLVLVWQVFASLRGNPLLVPGPAAVISEAWMYPGELLSNAAITIAKLLAAFLLSVPCALSLARLMQAPGPCWRSASFPARVYRRPPGFFCFLNASAIFAAACGTFFPVLTEMTERRSLSVAVLTGLRMAFLLVIAGEFFAANTGLGYLMLRATGTYNMPSLLAPILAAGIIGLLLEGLTRLIINRLLRA